MTRKIYRKSIADTIAENRLALTGMAKLAGKPAPVFSELSTDKKKLATTRTPSGEPTEAQILKSIMAYLRVHPGVAFAIRINSGTSIETYDGKERYVQYNSQKGMSDIFGVMQGGQAFFIEVKSKTGRLSQAQDDFLLMALQSGALAGVARSIDDVNKILALL